MLARVDHPVRLGVLVSGGGTTLQNFIEQIADGRLSAEIALVMSNKPNAFALERARRANIAAAVVTRKESGSAEEFSRRIFAAFRQAKVDLVCMAGFLQLLLIPEDYRHRVVNIHPALIPSFCGQGFYGRRVHEAVLEYGAKISGCTIHFADNEYDHGPIIMQRAVPVADDDTPDTLAARIFEQESSAYPEVIRLLAEGRILIDGRRVRIVL